MSSVENTLENGYANGPVDREYEEFSETERALRDSERRLAVELAGMTRLHELSMRLAQQTSLTEVMREVMEAATELLNSDYCTAQLLNSQDRALHLVAWKGFNQDFANRFEIVTEEGFTTCAAALGRRKRIVVGDLTANPEFKKFAELAMPLGIMAAVSTPLLADDGRLLGIFTTYWQEPHLPTEHQLRLLDLYVQQATRQVERRSAERVLKEREAQLRAELDDTKLLQSISAAMIHQDDVKAVYEQIIAAAVSIMRCDVASMQMLYPERGTSGELNLLASHGLTPEAQAFWEWVRTDSNCSCGEALRTRKRAMIPSVEQCEFMAGTEDRAAYLKAGIRAAHSTPLISRSGDLIGMISTHWNEPHEPSERDFRMFDILARQAADLVERTKAEQALQESQKQLAMQVSDLEALRQLSLLVAATSDRTTALNHILESAIKMVAAAKGNVQLYVAEDEALKIIAHRGFTPEFLEQFQSVPMGYSCCGVAMERHERVIIEDAFADPTFRDLADTYQRHGFRAVQSTPLFNSDGQLLGMFSTHFAERYRPSERDLRLLDQIAQQAGRVIERTVAEEAIREHLEERSRQAEALRASGDRLRRMVNVEGVGVLVFALPEGRLIDANDYFIRMFGYSRAEIESGAITWRTMTPPEYVAISEAQLVGFAATGRIGPYEKEYLRKDGSRSWLVFAGAALGDGTVVEYCIDVSDRKRAEEALREADRRKDEFLATLAHELRNPLAPIRNGLEIMRLSHDDANELEQSRTMMERQVDQMVRLVDDLLDLSRISRGKVELRKQRVELAAILQQAIETSRPLIEAGRHELTITMPSDVIFVDADLTRMAQVFSNLLNNAAKYTDPGGRIQVIVNREGEQAIVSVRDTGIGIAAPMLPKVFDMFTQVDSSLERGQRGLGIGLSIVKRLVEMHGGSIAVHSGGIGKGSEFHVRLILSSGPNFSAKCRDTATDASAGKRILVVDDNVDAARSLAKVLALMGNETRMAHDGLEALNVAGEYRPEIILLDIGMPVLNGYETALRIREQAWGRDVTLVALTGWGQDDDRRKSAEAGFNSHMVKPIDMTALKKLLVSGVSNS